MFVFPNTFVLSLRRIQNLVNVVKVSPNCLLNILHVYRPTHMHVTSLIQNSITAMMHKTGFLTNLPIVIKAIFFKKVKRCCIPVKRTPSRRYGVSLAIWDHTVLPAIRHKWTHPAITPARQSGTRLTNPGGWKAELTSVTGYIPRWFTHPQHRWSPIQVLTQQWMAESRIRNLLITSLKP